MGEDRVVGAGVADLQAVIRQIGERNGYGEKPGIDVLHGVPVTADHRHDLGGVRAVSPDHGPVAVLVGSQHRMRIVMLPDHQSLDVGGVGPQM